MRRSSRLLAVILILFAGLVIHDWIAPRTREISTRAAVMGIEQYQRWLSPRLEGKVTCRFAPSCSQYGLASVREHGALIGGARAVGRIARCGPWTPVGTVDPP
ncbi:MAG TPA: membrane protein insertion efficiency factor YidD [Thermoanaerobaculia bacterium]|nr:membrane protein insertion efficiency factor YidD [Thermoanaerobaculia bacterium]